MPYERLVALHITDEVMYAKYRKAMKPILATYGGYFTSDFKVSEVLLADADKSINRIFSISFPDRLAMETFFSNPEYKLIRNKYFEGSVANSYVLATYNKEI
ncbi:MAG: DUF1330 domain-containing protein [Balneolaceae bacterium]